MIQSALSVIFARAKEHRNLEGYAANQLRHNFVYGRAFVLILLFMLPISILPDLITIIFSDEVGFELALTQLNLLIFATAVYFVFALTYARVDPQIGGKITYLLLAFVLCSGILLTILDVKTGAGIIAIALTSIFSASLVSLRYSTIIIIYSVYFGTFLGYFKFFSPDSPQPNFAELIATYVLTVTFGLIIEATRVSRFKFTKVIEQQMGDLREKNLQLEQALNSKQTFISHISHEFRTPLNAVIGFSDALSMATVHKNDIKKVEEYASLINQSGRHLLELINNILMLSKQDLANIEVYPSRFNIESIIDESLVIIKTECESKKQQLTTAFPEDPLFVTTDRILLKQILINILSNAIKYTQRGGQIKCGVRQAEDGSIAITISDSGVGMTDLELSHALQPFAQVAPVYSRASEGTGLGLPIVMALAENIEAKVSFTSQKGVGTTVRILLPLEIEGSDDMI